MELDIMKTVPVFAGKSFVWSVFLLAALCSCRTGTLPDETEKMKPAINDVRTLTVHLDERFQTIDNFGASDCWSMQKIGAWSEENRTRIADLLFSRETGIGLSSWRFNIGGGICPAISHPWRTAETFEIGEGRYDWTRQANERWFLYAAKARGVERFIAFVNSPPARMTRNGLTFCSPEVGSTNLKEGFEGQFARYLCDILEHFRDEPDESHRIVFDWISPVNEPQWPWNGNDQEGNRASNDDLKHIYLALDAELKRRALPPHILGVESGSMQMPGMYGFIRSGDAKYGDYVKDFCGDPQMAEVLNRTIACHSYWADLLPQGLSGIRGKLRGMLDQHPEWTFWQTEYCVMQGPHNEGGGGRDLGMETALNVARIIHCDLTRLNAAAWHWWTAVSPENYKDGLIYTDYRNPGDAETIYPSKTLWAFGHFSRFVRPGHKRVRLEGADDLEGLMGSAYVAPDGQTLVVALINMSASPVHINVNRAGQPGSSDSGRFMRYVTSEVAGDDLRPEGIAEADKPLQIPARSVVTLVGDV